jgi:serine/threonine-protein kinase
MSELPERLKAALADRYELLRELGEGGMATVYLAEDLKHRRKVAVKVLKPELAAVVGGDRFLAEIETTANLQHPNILPLFDSGEADGFLFFVMPFVEGETLRDRLDREKQLPVGDAVRIATDMAEALDYAHRQGVIHRDIKPANVLLQEGRPLIADFGIAIAVGAAGGSRLTETGLSVGTPYYMSPEQATGDQTVGPATDIYALGCVLYETLVGEPPFYGATAQAVLGKIIAGAPVSATTHRTAIPTNVDAAIRCALEKLPADRFPEAQAFGKALNDPSFRHGGPEEVAAAASASGGGWKVAAIALSASVTCSRSPSSGAPSPTSAAPSRFRPMEGRSPTWGAERKSRPLVFGSGSAVASNRDRCRVAKACTSYSSRPMGRGSGSSPKGVSSRSFLWGASLL